MIVREIAAAVFRGAIKAIAFVGASVGLCITAICCAVLACTAAVGYPDFFGTGIMLNDRETDELPEDDLIFFESCAAEELSVGDFAVYHTAAGIRAGRIYSLSQTHLTVRSDDGSVVAFSASALIGKAVSHNPRLGKAASCFAAQSGAGLIGGLAVALTAMFLLVADIRRKSENPLQQTGKWG